MAHARPFTVMRLLLMRRTLGSPHGKLLSDGGAKKHFHKMNGNEVKVLRRGASVQQLGCTSALLPSQMEDFDVSFAETFTTLASKKQKKLDDIKEEHVNGVSPYVPYLITTIKEVFELKNKNTSSLSIERLVKKFCTEYETLGRLSGSLRL